MEKRILLAEDEENLLKTIRLNLELEGYAVVSAIDGASAIRAFEPGEFDLVILDVMLPLVSGFDICTAIRDNDKSVPVLFLTAKAEGEDRIRGLKLGADDYLTKPFQLEEFLLRVQNLLKRSTRTEGMNLMSSYSFGSNTIKFASYEAVGNGQSWSLTKREAELLRLLISKKSEVVPREEILAKLWKNDVQPTGRAIDNYILSFRKYFEANPKEPRYFHSIRGVGYRFTE